MRLRMLAEDIFNAMFDKHSIYTLGMISLYFGLIYHPKALMCRYHRSAPFLLVALGSEEIVCGKENRNRKKDD